MQRTLHFTRQPGSRASFSTSSSTSLLNPQSTRYLTPLAPRRVYRSTASSPSGGSTLSGAWRLYLMTISMSK